MTANEAIRYLDSQAKRCRDHDDAEALCLLLPALMSILDLEPMTAFEALDFHAEMKRTLQTDFRFDPEPSTVGCGE